jgi:hypothetical protein
MTGASVKGIDIGRHRIDVGLGIGCDDPPDALAELLRVEPRQLAGVDGIVDHETHGAGIGRQPALQHHVPAPDDGQRHDWKTGLERQQKAAALEAAHASVATARSFGKHDQRQTVRCQPRGPSEDPRSIGTTAIDEHVPGAAKVPAQERDVPERFLRDDPQLIRQRPEQDGNVVDALVI